MNAYCEYCASESVSAYILDDPVGPVVTAAQAAEDRVFAMTGHTEEELQKAGDVSFVDVTVTIASFTAKNLVFDLGSCGDTSSLSCGVEVAAAAPIGKPLKILDDIADGLRGATKIGNAANTGSRLAEASGSAFRAADKVGDFTVSAKHLPGAGGRWNKWAEGVDINGTIANALRSDAATFLPNAGGAADSFIVRTNVGSVIGTKGETYVKAVISNDGRIITAHPVK